MRMAHDHAALWSSPDVGRAVHDVAQERVEHEQRPQRRAVVAPSRLVLVDQLARDNRGRRIRCSASRSPSSASRTRVAQRAAEPARERHGEAHLRAGRGPRAADRGSIAFLSSHLPSCPRTLSDDGRRRQPLDERMVHQRLAHLERVRHARAVDLGVDVADQIGLEVEILDQRERVVGVRALRAWRRNTSTAL